MSRERRAGISREALQHRIDELTIENARLKSDRWIIDDTDLAAVTALTEALNDCEGYWRIGRAVDGNYWARYKWTRGSFSGSYVIGGDNSLAKAILCASVEIDRCNAGKRSPILDKGYRKS